MKTTDSYSKTADLEKTITDTSNMQSDSIRKQNAEKQETLNRSKNVQRLLKNQRLKQRKMEFLSFLKKFSMKDVLVLCFYFVLPIIVIAIFNRFKDVAFLSLLLEKVARHRVDLYLSQLSLTFITISVMSIFSDGNAVIYWQNIVKKTLIDPPASCFKAYFSYSFIYLFAGTIAILFAYDVGIGVCFIFNVICLFDLSRTMVNCYYNPNTKKRKLVRDFIDQIETANIACAENIRKETSADVRDMNEQCIEEVRAIFEDFNYYTNEAYNNKKYNIIRENLAVYGKLLAHASYSVKVSNEFSMMEWYDKKTYKAYYDLVKNYYMECCSFILGHCYSNATPIGNTVESEIINNIIDALANDVPNIHEENNFQELLLYRFYVKMLYIARAVDYENFDQYIMSLEPNRSDIRLTTRKAEIGRKIQQLCKGATQDKCKQMELTFALLELISCTI